MLNRKFTSLPISDGYRNFPVLFDGIFLYFPDYSPEAYGDNVRYRVKITDMSKIDEDSKQHPLTCDVAFDHRDFEAVTLFRYDGHTYRQGFNTTDYSDAVDDHILYIELHVVNEDGSENTSYSGAQGVKFIESDYLEPIIFHKDDIGWVGVSMLQQANQNILTQANLNTAEKLSSVYKTNRANNKIRLGVEAAAQAYVKKYFPGATIQTSCEMALTDEDNIYWIKKDVAETDGIYWFDLDDSWRFNFNHQYINGLQFTAILHLIITFSCPKDKKDGRFNDYEHGLNNDVNGEAYNFDTGVDTHTLHIDLKSNPYPLTEQVYAELISDDKKILTLPNTMNIIKPRFVNQTVQNKVVITSQTDSKANIIQPIFFKVRDLAQIIIHPEVTENICINLDAYKSQVDRFFIKIEGVSFMEIGRVESGVIFKVKGNLLPGSLSTGTYYILNQDGDLVTTGKYKYDK